MLMKQNGQVAWLRTRWRVGEPRRAANCGRQRKMWPWGNLNHTIARHEEVEGRFLPKRDWWTSFAGFSSCLGLSVMWEVFADAVHMMLCYANASFGACPFVVWGLTIRVPVWRSFPEWLVLCVDVWTWLYIQRVRRFVRVTQGENVCLRPDVSVA